MFFELLLSVVIIILFIRWFQEEEPQPETVGARRSRWGKELYDAREMRMKRTQLAQAMEDVSEVESEAEFYHVLDCNGFQLNKVERREMEAWRAEKSIE